ncbi:glycosyltransferase family 4 protein [Calidifontibacter sp. DB0510]|uniref:D-inositol 3-phosphate glycosyltransferase n=1 Tax=Metallococcus carri TaxID=1656884 RepID=A0A967E7U5_9MICO|nr:glycosyltransferase [Metallococcus carri]NHN54512.1 glycosyltransferase family 4 protein [Metallococcus carri]NOP36649.1 glycosyltransferase [Calidifontibacter sp. DB2511S]
MSFARSLADRDARELRIAVIAPSRFPVAEPFAGGQESFVWQLCETLRARGARVVLYAAAGSDPTVCDELQVFPPLSLSDTAWADTTCPPPEEIESHLAYLWAMRHLRQRTDIDVVHNHSLHHYPVALADLVQAPMVTTLHTPPFSWLEATAQLADRRQIFTSVSHFLAAQWSTLSHRIQVVHNGVDPARFRLGPGGDTLAWVGRITPEKAPHLAIQAALRRGRRLRLAGPVSDKDYAAAHVFPFVDGEQVHYAGHLSGPELAAFYGTSTATLVTPDWTEPFGLVAAESLMCGTPVVALARGGLPELVRPGVNGVLVDAPEQLADAIAAVDGLDRPAIRAAAEQELSVHVMVDTYLALYRGLAADVAQAV